jgi:uncharacterized protein
MVEPSNNPSIDIPDLVKTDIHTTLLSDDPDCTRILEILEKDGQLTPEVAHRVLYDVVLQINAALFPPITKLELIHTEGCNLACSYCFEKEMLGYRCMPADVGRRAIDLLFNYSQERPEVSITHFGGEPTVNFEGIRGMTAYAEEKARSHNKTVKFSMTSNGVLINDAMAAYFAEHNIMVLLSIDGLRETHNRFRVDKRGQGTFDRVLACLRTLKRTQGWIGVKMTVMPVNAANLFNDVVGLYQLGVNQFIIGYATGIRWSEQEMRTYVEQWRRAYQWYQEMSHDALRITDFDDFGKPAGGPVFGCQAGNDSITVTVNGSISPCSKMLALNNKDPMMKLGDVEHGLTHLRNRLELTSSARLINACEEIGIVHSYQGGCWATNYSDNQDLFRPSMQDHTFKLLQQRVCAL